MSAREPFKFPPAHPNSGQQFPEAHARSAAAIHLAPASENLLNVSGKDTEKTEGVKRDTHSPANRFTVFRKPDENGPPSNAMKPSTSGLGRVSKRSSNAGTAPMEYPPVVRPGTANPYSRSFQAQAPNVTVPHPPVIAPAPQKPIRISPSLGGRGSGSFSGPPSSGFKVPYPSVSNVVSDLNPEKNAHISIDNGIRTAPGEFPQNIKFRPASRANDAQEEAPKETPSFSPLRHSTKRSRDSAEDEGADYDPGNQPKRFKDVRKPTVSPSSTGRPSSGMSHSMGRHDGRAGTPASQRHSDYYSQRLSQPSHSPPDLKAYPSYERAPPRGALSALQKLLGTDPDAYVKNHMDNYDEMMLRWANCTVEEWKAGADEVAADYHKLLDHVKLHLEYAVPHFIVSVA
ncbi:hypothetical protein HYPSUDRAFT_199946 [Hypholoma sublateritium FD-334 SS-4]|uniref:Uncharacterized protein n=1 Tax=Hypholoma sublateritium (strain FD-334 SS-4) TaxID=945553 RepID=A0A0D2P247_HYPSF|nr:hypothetical protein HYPSUDRAFT_199946 [Hypholoma sublateritium FD-334 SS-4]